MRIPTPEFNGVKSRPVDSRYSNLDFRDGTDAVVQGVGQFSKGVEAVGGYVAEVKMKAKSRADAIAADSLFTQAQAFTTERLHGYNEAPAAKAGPAGYDSLTDEDIEAVGSPGKHVPGYLDTVGTQAHEQSGPALDAIQEKYESLLKTAGNEEQKTIARQRMATLFESVRSQTAQHESRQFRVAEQAATKGLLDTALGTADNMYDKPKELAPFVDDALASLKRTSLPEEYEAAKADYLSKVSQTIIGAYLRHDDVVGAAMRYGADEQLLGGDVAERMKHRIDTKAAALNRAATEVEAQRESDRMVASATLLNGKLDEAKASKLAAQIPAGPLRDETEKRLDDDLARKRRQWDQKVATFSDSALTSFLGTHRLSAVPAETKQWLTDNAPKEWAKLEDRERIFKGYQRRLAEGKTGETPEQLEALTALEADMNERPEYYREMSTEEFFTSSATQGLAPPGLKRAAHAFAKSKKDDPIKVGEFTKFVSDAVGATPAFSGKGPAVKAKRDAFRARLGEERRAYLEANGDKEPPPPEREAMVQRATVEIVTGQTWYGSDVKKPAYLVPEAKPKARPVPDPPASKVPVVTATGARGFVPADKLDAWLAAHPGAKRGQ